MSPFHSTRLASCRPSGWRLAWALLLGLIHGAAALAATMSVAPLTGITSSGNAGGPFSSASTTYTISNTGPAPINWTAANTTAWLSLSSTGGSIGVGGNATVVATINSSANALAIGKYSDTINIANTSDGTGNAALPVYLTVTANGTWTPLAHTAPGSVDLMHLLLDGTVIAHDGDFGWFKLTPDSTGSYVNGTWTTLTSSYDSRLYFSSQILLDGRLFTAGGEYGTGTRTGEVYDPLTNTWTITPVPGVGFVDSVSEILNSGQVLIDPVEPSASGYTILYNPSTNTWTTGPKLVHGYNEDEATWIKLPDDSILTIDSETTTSERYIPSLNEWVADSTVPVTMYDSSLGELGPGFLLPSGQAFMLGGTSNTAYYTPTGTTSPGAWVAGPEIPDGLGINDGAGAMLVTGKVLFVAGPPTTYDGPTTYFIFDPIANTITQVNGPTGTTSSTPPYTTAMLDLPDGTVLYSTFGTQLYVYSPSGAPISAGKPTISTVAQNADGSFHLTGTLLNGISEGAVYGDDAQMSTNYPIIRLISSGGTVYFARSDNRSTTSVMTGSAILSTDFYLPAGLPAGTYSLITSANGISSDPLPITFSPITVSLPASAVEGSAPVTGTVTLPSAPPSNLTINLASSDTSRATVPTSITVLAGQTTATFSLTIIQQSLLNGNEAVIVSAAAAGYQTGNAPFVVVNNESAVLSISPSGSYNATGVYGGGFSPGSVAYTLTNIGNFTLSWTAAKGQSWLTLSSTSGTLAAGANTTVTATINSTANTLAVGSYSDTIIFDNITSGVGDLGISVSLSVTGAPSMSVTSGNFSSSGTTGGPFSPSSTVYTVSNPGNAPLTWTAAKTQSWVTLSSTGGTIAPGGTSNVTVSINSGANSLTAGSYSDTVTFTNATNGVGNTTRAVGLTVNPSTPTLSVSPATGFSALGNFGGPFSPASAAYTVSNPGGGTMSWSASNTSAWLTVSPSSGTLGAGANTTVTVSINPAANTLSPGSYSDTVSYVNLTNGSGNTSTPAALTVNAVAPSMSVTPSSSSFSGNYGGPFSSGNATYTIFNAGSSSMSYTATTTTTWLSLSSGSGTIGPGGSANVTASVTSRANTFVGGTYSGSISFKNTINGVGNATSDVSLAVTGIPQLSVAATNVAASGSSGGPFSPSTTTVRLTNPGSASVTWTASANVNWLTVSSGGTIATGGGANLLASIDANASALSAGVYSGTVTVTNASNGIGNATLAATLTVYPPGPALGVSPATGVAATGAYAGPFTPASVSYTISNGGNAAMSWTAANSSAWLALSPASGTLGVGANTTVTATISPAANTLAPGSYTDTIAFTNVTNGTGNTTLAASLAITGPALSVSAAPLSSSGPVGGPFAPASVSATVTNNGNATLDWTASNTSAWLTLSSNGGSLAPGANATVTASLNSAANVLTAGAYSDVITFTNSDNGLGNTTVAASLSVIPAVPLLSAPPYTSGSGITLQWTASPGATGYQVQIDSAPDFVTPLSTATPSTASASFTQLTNGATYYYRARAVASGGVVSAWSGAVSSTQDATPPLVAILSPAGSSNTTQATLALQGTAADAISGVATVAVNGLTASSGGGFSTWSVANLPLALGANTVTATATDNASPTGNSASASITITRVANATGDGLPDAWKVAYGLDPESSTGVNGPLGDPAGDGVPNILKYAFNLSPLQECVIPVTVSSAVSSGDGLRYLTLSYIKRTDTIDLTYAVEVSTDLDTWTTPTSQITQLSATPNADGVTQTVTVQIGPAIAPENPTLFTRIGVTLH